VTVERRAFARLLRKQPTKAEDILWRCLRGSRFHLGVRVIRFANEEVEGDIDSVLEQIRTELRLPFL